MIFIRADYHDHSSVSRLTSALEHHFIPFVFGFGYNCSKRSGACIFSGSDKLVSDGVLPREFVAEHQKLIWGLGRLRGMLAAQVESATHFISIDTYPQNDLFGGSAPVRELELAIDRYRRRSHPQPIHIGPERSTVSGIGQEYLSYARRVDDDDKNIQSLVEGISRSYAEDG